MSFITLNIISSLVILLMAGFFSTQGAFSSILGLLMAAFAAILAMGVGHAAGSLMPPGQVEYGQGVGYLATFVLTFMVLRIVCDMLLPKNIPLPKLADRIAGGLLGVVTGLIVTGAVIIGLEMMPFGTSIMGNPALEDGQELTVESIQASRAFPAKFVTGMYYLTNGGSLGGGKLAVQHPDLGVELTLKRHTAAAGVRQTLSPKLITMTGAYYTTAERLNTESLAAMEPKWIADEKARNAKELKDAGQPALSDDALTDAAKKALYKEFQGDPSKFKYQPVEQKDPSSQLLVVRTMITKGSSSMPDGNASFDLTDTDKAPFFDVTPAQVRLVSRKGDKGDVRAEVRPVGYLNKGLIFEKVGLDGKTVMESGKVMHMPLIEDYSTQPMDTDKSTVWADKTSVVKPGPDFDPNDKTSLATDDVIYIEWVFEISDGMVPEFMEVKRGGIVKFADNAISTEKVLQPLAAMRYPARDYLNNVTTLTLTVLEGGKPLAGAKVWVLQPDFVRKGFIDLLGSASSALEKNKDSSNWPTTPEPGVPSQSTLRIAYNAVVNSVQNTAASATIPWGEAMQVLFYGQMKTNGRQNVQDIKDFFLNKFGPKVEGDKSYIASTSTNANGKIDPMELPAVNVTIVVVAPVGNRAVRVWVVNETLVKKVPMVVELGRDIKPGFEVDLDKKN